MDGKTKFAFVVEYVRDIEIAKRFYVDVLGLEILREHPQFVQFESFAIASDEPIGKDGTREVYWLVDNADEAYERLSAKAEVCLPLTTYPFGKVFGIKDPDGHPRYVYERS